MRHHARFLVAAAMRNEGPFLLEWVAWYRMLGFEILIATNDCTDQSPAILNALQDLGVLTHITHSPNPETPPKRSAHRAIRAHPLVTQAEWLLLCDVDEFLVFHGDEGGVRAFVEQVGEALHGIALHWRAFGSGGATRWADGLQHRRALWAAPHTHSANTSFKSLIRWPQHFSTLGAHSPRDFIGPGTWGAGVNVWVDSDGRPLRRYHPDKAAQRATAPDRVTHRRAQMNHYAVRNRESFHLKVGQPSAAAFKDRYTPAFYEKFDRNEQADRSALRHRADFSAQYTQLWDIPEIPRLHHHACAQYVARLCAAHGQDPALDERYIHHMDEATSRTATPYPGLMHTRPSAPPPARPG